MHETASILQLAHWQNYLVWPSRLAAAWCHQLATAAPLQVLVASIVVRLHVCLLKTRFALWMDAKLLWVRWRLWSRFQRLATPLHASVLCEMWRRWATTRVGASLAAIAVQRAKVPEVAQPSSAIVLEVLLLGQAPGATTLEVVQLQMQMATTPEAIKLQVALEPDKPNEGVPGHLSRQQTARQLLLQLEPLHRDLCGSLYQPWGC